MTSNASSRHSCPSARTLASVLLFLILGFAWLPAAALATNTGPSPLVDVNSADAASLAEQLPGVGPVKAQAIIDHRDRQGRFSSVEQLLDVKGIGPVTLEKLRPLLFITGIDTARGSDVGQIRGQHEALTGTPSSAAGAGELGDAGNEVPETPGYFSIDSGSTVIRRHDSGDSAEQATVRAVREVIRRVLDDGPVQE